MDISENIRGLIKDFTCGYCSARSGYIVAFSDWSAWRGAWGDLYAGCAIAVLECSNCKMLNALIFEVDEEDNDIPFDGGHIGPYLVEHPEILQAGYDESQNTYSPVWMELLGQYPHGLKLNEAVPEQIRQDMREAGNCLAVGASNAAIIMCRRVVERLATHIGVKSDKNRMLGATLKELEDRKLVSENLLKALREIKDWGNITTHPSEDEKYIDLSEARKIVDLVFHIVESVFPKVDINKTADELKRMRENKRTGND